MFGQDVRFVESAVRRLMGDEHVRIVRDEIPVFANLHHALSSKSPVSTHRVDRRSPELHSFEGDPGVLKVNGFGQVSAGQFRITVEKQIVIAGDEQLVPEGKRFQPGVEVVDLFHRATIEVAGVDQDVASRQPTPMNVPMVVLLRSCRSLFPVSLIRSSVRIWRGGCAEAARRSICVHADDSYSASEGQYDQPHMHLMFSERAVTEATREIPAERFFKRNGAKKDLAWNDRNKPEEVRVRWVEVMNGAMERAGIEQRVDARSWAEQGREDLAALREDKTLGGEGLEVAQRREKIEEQRRLRTELPAPHLDQAAAIAEIERETEKAVGKIERWGEEQLARLEKMIAEVKEQAQALLEATRTLELRRAGRWL